jgi:hypothetical protein
MMRYHPGLAVGHRYTHTDGHSVHSQDPPHDNSQSELNVDLDPPQAGLSTHSETDTRQSESEQTLEPFVLMSNLC